MTDTTTRLALSGASGRMGRRIAQLADDDPSFVVAHSFDKENPCDPRAFGAEASKRASFDVVVDFSSPTGTALAAELALRAGAALLVGTTGLDGTTVDRLGEAAKKIPVMIAPNTSSGVAVMRHLCREAARLLPDHDIDLIEMHHTAKLDSPSGTARALASALAEGGRPIPPERILAVRAGDIVGEHTIQFAGTGEIIRLGHSATSRDLFARGALRAARWLHRQPAGMHTIEQSLGLRPGAGP